jgi:hypothetical protein
MKKSKAIELLKAKTHSIKMDRREVKDVQLLNEILKCFFKREVSGAFGGVDDFYYLSHDEIDCSLNANPYPNHINISEIEVDDEFVNGEEVEGSKNKVLWTQYLYFIGKKRDGVYLVENSYGHVHCFTHIRKPQTERDKAIQTIKELKEKFNIKNEEV